VGSPGLGSYDESAWSDNPVWSELGFRVDGPHYFHYDLHWSGNENGACVFDVRAYGDLDDDGTYSTYERSGAADPLGINAAAGIYVDQELE
jgi:type IV pilus assembly protein PilA